MKKSVREAALNWWNTLNFNQKRDEIEKNKESITGSLDRRPNDLTGREIEIIYLEHQKTNGN